MSESKLKDCNLACSPRHNALLIRILDADDETAIVWAGEEEVVECDTQSSEMHFAGRRWRETNTNAACCMRRFEAWTSQTVQCTAWTYRHFLYQYHSTNFRQRSFRSWKNFHFLKCPIKSLSFVKHRQEPFRSWIIFTFCRCACLRVQNARGPYS